VMLMGAVVPILALAYLKSRSKEAMVGLLQGWGGGCVQEFCLHGWGCAHHLLLVLSAMTVP